MVDTVHDRVKESPVWRTQPWRYGECCGVQRKGDAEAVCRQR
jgi:hypothetical protein